MTKALIRARKLFRERRKATVILEEPQVQDNGTMWQSIQILSQGINILPFDGAEDT